MEKKDTLQAKEERQEQRKRGLKNAKFRLFMLCMAVMSALSVNAFASEGNPTTSDDTISSMINDASSTVPALANLAWKIITGNPLTTVCVVVLLASFGFGLIRRARRTVK